MKKIRKHIEIVRTTTPDMGAMGKRSCDNLYAFLRQHFTHVGVTILNDFSDLERFMRQKPDLVFLGMKYVPDNADLGRYDPQKTWLSSYFDAHNIVYTGSGRAAMELELDKPLAKQHIRTAGLATSRFFVARQEDEDFSQNYVTSLTFPLFVKPTDMGGGQGVDDDSIVTTPSELHAKVRSIANTFHSDSLVEEYLPGREFSVAILEGEYAEERMVMPVEVFAEPNAQGKRIRGRASKTSVSECILAVADADTRHRVARLASDVYDALGGRDYGRIDIRLDKDGMPQFLEANLIPSLIDNWGTFPKACAINMNMDYATMILRIINVALARNNPILPALTMPDMDMAASII